MHILDICKGNNDVEQNCPQASLILEKFLEREYKYSSCRLLYVWTYPVALGNRIIRLTNGLFIYQSSHCK